MCVMFQNIPHVNRIRHRETNDYIAFELLVELRVEL